MILKVKLSSLPITLAGDTAGPPSEFRVLPTGEYPTTKGLLLVDDISLASVPQRHREYGNDIVVDYEHQTINAEWNGQPAPAAGWISSLEAREDGIYALGVSWTERATEFMRAREYRYFSPTVYLEYIPASDQVRVTELDSVALTNRPASINLPPLVASRKGNDMNQQAKIPLALLTALALSETASEGEVATQVVALKNFEGMILELASASDREQAIGTLTALRDKAARADQLQEQLDRAQAAAEASEREQLIAQALKDRKLAPAQAKEGGFARTVPLATLKAYLKDAPTIIPGEQAGEPATTAKQWDEMSGPERAELYTSDPDLYRQLRRDATGR